MKKTLLMLSLILGVLSLGISQAYAVPVTDGTLGAGEWANLNFSGGSYPYYLEVFDPNEPDNQFNNTDISHGILLQELSGGFGGTPATTDDGIYLLLEVYSPPPTLDFQSGAPVTGIPNITMQGDLLGDGLADPFNIFLRHYNTAADFGIAADVDRVEACVGSAASCLVIPPGGWLDLTSIGGTFGRGSVLEYYIPSGTLGTPPSPPGTPFPTSFIGTLTYDNGAGGLNSSDDVVMGQLAIPEPNTMFLMFTGILGLAGFAKFRFWL